MYKKNKTELKKIYEEEYLKALKEEERKKLNREIARIKEKAKRDAERKYMSWKDRTRGSVTKTHRKTKKVVKRVRKRSPGIHANLEKANRRLMEDIMGY